MSISEQEPVAGTAARRAAREAARKTTAPRPDRPVTAARRRQLDPDALAALEDERDFLLGSLRDLEREHDAGDVDDVDYEALKDDYTARAADVLRAVETRQAARAAARTERRPGRRILVAVLVGLFAVGGGFAVAQSSGRRGAGDQITGDIRQTARDKILEARTAMGNQQYREAIGLFDEVIALSPSNAEAYTYKGWLLTLVSRQAGPGEDQDLLRARALQELDRAVEIDPGYADARVFRASLRKEIGPASAGLADLDALKPGAVPVDLRGLVDRLRQDLQGQVPPS